ncbi:MAG: hypothetical protein ACXVIP_00940 [Halobacteriota archaeon]
MDKEASVQQSCIDVRYTPDNKTQTGAVCVALNKNIGKKERKVDIIFMEERGAWSVRSVTELMNILMKWQVSLDERKRIFDFVAERLRVIAADETLSQ